MKKTIFIFLVLLTFSLAAFPQKTWLNDSTLLKVKANALTEYFNKSANDKDSIKNQELFFQEFPNNFKGLVRLFGYEDTTLNILGWCYYDYIDRFNNLTSIPRKEYFHKIIKVGIGGKWNADAVSLFQDGIWENFKKNPNLAFSLLQTYPQKDIESFWIFYFDGPHPDLRKEEFGAQKTNYPKVYNSMNAAYKKVLADWKDE